MKRFPIFIISYTISSLVGVYLIYNFEKNLDNNSQSLYDKKILISISFIFLLMVNFLNNPFLNLLATCIIVLLAIKSTFHKITKKIIITNIYFVFLLILLEEITYVIVSAIFNFLPSDYYDSLSKDIYLIIISKALILLIYKPMINIVLKRNYNYLKTYEVKIIFNAFILLFIAIINIAIVSKKTDITLNIGFSLICLAVYARLFHITTNFQENEFKIKELAILKEKNNKLYENYLALMENYKKDRRIIHDFPNQLLTIKAVYSKDFKLGEKYSENVLRNIKNETQFKISGITMPEIIIDEYKKICLNKGISLNGTIENLKIDLIEDTDWSIILTNLMNNSIENISIDNPCVFYKICRSHNYIVIE